jgi:phage/plasmid primase-like uncharacterized protein
MDTNKLPQDASVSSQRARIVLAEGVATGASWHQVTGDTVVVAFSANNLAHVAAYVQADLVAADNDSSLTGERAASASWASMGGKESITAHLKHCRRDHRLPKIIAHLIR